MQEVQKYAFKSNADLYLKPSVPISVNYGKCSKQSDCKKKKKSNRLAFICQFLSYSSYRELLEGKHHNTLLSGFSAVQPSSILSFSFRFCILADLIVATISWMYLLITVFEILSENQDHSHWSNLLILTCLLTLHHFLLRTQC